MNIRDHITFREEREHSKGTRTVHATLTCTASRISSESLIVNARFDVIEEVKNNLVNEIRRGLYGNASEDMVQAAPDLLAACKEAVNLLKCIPSKQLSPLYRQLCCAIEKAEGKP